MSFQRRRLLRCLLVPALAGMAACASGTGPSVGEAAGPAAGEAEVADEPRSVQPGAPGTASRRLTGEELRTRVDLPHTEADVRFMQNMIHHHAQALVMARLVPDRSSRDDIRLLAARIERSQADEIALMQRWLEVRGEEAPEVDLAGGHAAHGHDGHLMAGMLTPEQIRELSEARGPEFDRLFVEFMIFHHEGALTMVDELFSIAGSAQDSEIYRFASHVDADQRIEIGRMRRMLADLR